MNLPADKNLDTRLLTQIYNNTVATYKYYWFVSILDIVVKEQRRQISFWEVVVGMITEAWYPIHYFHSDVENPRGGVRGVIPSKQSY